MSNSVNVSTTNTQHESPAQPLLFQPLLHAGPKACRQRPWEGYGMLGPEQIAQGEVPWTPLAPSSQVKNPEWEPPRQLTERDIAELIDAFVAAVADSRNLVSYYRRDRDHRFVFGYRGPFRAKPTAADANALADRVRALFPALKDTPFPYCWSGRVAMTVDRVPHLHQPEEGVFIALGYNGRGVAQATMMGKVLAAACVQGSARNLAYPVTPLQPIPFHAFHSAGMLHLTQPAVSVQLKSLEEELNVKLLDRTASGMVMTQAGRVLLPMAKRVLSAVEEFRMAADIHTKALAGLLRIGVIMIDPDYLRLGTLMSALSEKHAGLEVNLQVSGVQRCISGIEEGSLDGAFYAGERPHSAIAMKTLTPLRYCIVAPVSWAHLLENISWSNLGLMPWIRAPQPSAHYSLVAGIFQHASIEPLPFIYRADRAQEPRLTAFLETLDTVWGPALDTKGLHQHQL